LFFIKKKLPIFVPFSKQLTNDKLLSNGQWEDWTFEVWINKGKDFLLLAGEGYDIPMSECHAPSFANSATIEECAITRTIFDNDLNNR